MELPRAHTHESPEPEQEIRELVEATVENEGDRYLLEVRRCGGSSWRDRVEFDARLLGEARELEQDAWHVRYGGHRRREPEDVGDGHGLGIVLRRQSSASRHDSRLGSRDFLL